MADMSTIAYAPSSAALKYSLAKGSELSALYSPEIHEGCSDEDIEPILRIQEHLHSIENGYGNTNAPLLSTGWNGEEKATDNLGHERATKSIEGDFAFKPESFLFSENYSEPKMANSFIEQAIDEVGDPSSSNETSESERKSKSEVREEFGMGLYSDPPYPTSYKTASLGFEQPDMQIQTSPSMNSNLSMSPDLPIIGSGTGSLQSPELLPYEYQMQETFSGTPNQSYTVPQFVPSSARPEEFNESQFTNLNSMHNGYYSEGDFPSATDKTGGTPELNSWQKASIAAAYADASKTAAIRTLIEASYFPQSPDLYDSLGRSLTGGDNLDYHPIYGVYRSYLESQPQSPIVNSPSFGFSVNSRTCTPSITKESAAKLRSVKPVSAPEFETRVLPRPSFAGNNPAGGSFMLVNLRAKKRGPKKRAIISSTRVKKSSNVPRRMSECSTWNLNDIEED